MNAAALTSTDATARPYTIRRVPPDEAPVVVDILREAAAWTRRFGRPIWPARRFTAREHRALAAAGALVGGYEAGRLVACCRVQDADPVYWPDAPPGEALYLHKLAARRSAAGRGWAGRLIAWAADKAGRAGARALRLDTLAGSALVGVYAAHGFRVVDERRPSPRGRWIVRMERPLRPARLASSVGDS